MGRCREGAVVLAGGEVVKVSNDKDILGAQKLLPSLKPKWVEATNNTVFNRLCIFDPPYYGIWRKAKYAYEPIKRMKKVNVWSSCKSTISFL